MRETKMETQLYISLPGKLQEKNNIYIYISHFAIETIRVNGKLQVRFRVFDDISAGKRRISGHAQRATTDAFASQLPSGTYRSES